MGKQIMDWPLMSPSPLQPILAGPAKNDNSCQHETPSPCGMSVPLGLHRAEPHHILVQGLVLACSTASDMCAVAQIIPQMEHRTRDGHPCCAVQVHNISCPTGAFPDGLRASLGCASLPEG